MATTITTVLNDVNMETEQVLRERFRSNQQLWNMRVE